MNAVESAPSANKSRNRLGKRNAIKKASRFFPAPNKPANTVSRIRPSTRLERTAMPTTPVARVLIRRSAASVIVEQRTESADLRKQKLLGRPRMTRIYSDSVGRTPRRTPMNSTTEGADVADARESPSHY